MVIPTVVDGQPATPAPADARSRGIPRALDSGSPRQIADRSRLWPRTTMPRTLGFACARAVWSKRLSNRLRHPHMWMNAVFFPHLTGYPPSDRSHRPDIRRFVGAVNRFMRSGVQPFEGRALKPQPRHSTTAGRTSSLSPVLGKTSMRQTYMEKTFMPHRRPCHPAPANTVARRSRCLLATPPCVEVESPLIWTRRRPRLVPQYVREHELTPIRWSA